MILNLKFIREFITNNQKEQLEHNGKVSTQYDPVPYRWTHGATEYSLGDGLLIYSIIHYMRAKVCVCLGSGGGFIPRIMTQARLDLYDSGIFEGKKEFNWGDIGSTFLVDATNGVGGEVDYLEENSFFRSKFFPRFINDTTENAYYNFFVKQDIKIDLLHIDADHTFEGVKKDFELYSQRMNKGGIITIHDTDKNYVDNFVEIDGHEGDDLSGPSEFVKTIDKRKFEVINFFNHGIRKDKPSSTGLTLVRKK